jgi:hypothetical protein
MMSLAGTTGTSMAVPEAIRKMIMASSVIPLWSITILPFFVMIILVLLVPTMAAEWQLTWAGTSVLAVVTGFASILFVIPILVLKVALSWIAAVALDRHLSLLDVNVAIRRQVRKQVLRKFWFDAFTRTVPTPYRRIIIVGKSGTESPFWVMDVGTDFNQVRFEQYLPGELPSPPLTKTNNVIDGYKYYQEWIDGKTKGLR